MTGLKPTVGLMAVLENVPLRAMEGYTLAALSTLILPTKERRNTSNALLIMGRIGTETLEILLSAFAIENAENTIGVGVNFDDETVDRLIDSSGLTLMELFAPYVSAFQSCKECAFITVGFEISVPSSTSEQSLIDAGIVSTLFSRKKGGWVRKEIPATGVH